MAVLKLMGQQFPNIDAALSRIAILSTRLTEPKGTVHILSDVHGEYKKLRHVINNASGMLRPLVESRLTAKVSPEELQELLRLIFYPREMFELKEKEFTEPAERRSFCRRVLFCLLDIIRTLARHQSPAVAARMYPSRYRDLFLDLVADSREEPNLESIAAVVDSFDRHDRAFYLLRLSVHLLRDLAINELIIAGDFWDRGPRGDKVMDYLMAQPNCILVWGNHDAAWMGACLGQQALVAHVTRISLRYGRLAQLEEGYGIPLVPLEQLVKEVYNDDPAECFVPRKSSELGNTQLIARMQKAAAVIQFKLDGQTIARNPEFAMDHRRLLHQIDKKAGTVTIDGKTYPLRDTNLPTLDPENPYELSPEEKECIERLTASFVGSQKLWQHMRWMISRGKMYLIRDRHLIFHGCVPVDANGDYQPFPIDGTEWKGKPLFDAMERVFARALYQTTQKDCDLLWYFWQGARSPLFGKDRICTFENDLVADKETHKESKNAYFNLIHEVPFCDKILAEFGVAREFGLIVNGHVPVKIDDGENPIKRSRKAITIDGAFSEAYGDHGYTLGLEPRRTFLAEHHHFDSVQAAVKEGVDIIPQITNVIEFPETRLVVDTEEGDAIRQEIHLLEELITAYNQNSLLARDQPGI